jgi:hypothetical protein
MEDDRHAAYSFQVASDVVRDGIGLELLDREGNVVAEVFRSDASRSWTVATFRNELPLDIVEALIAAARSRLGGFLE